MRTIRNLGLLLGLIALAAHPSAGQAVEKKLATLGPGETIVTQESRLLGDANCEGDDFCIISVSMRAGKPQYFIYDKNGRKGPFDKISESQICAGAESQRRPAAEDSQTSTEGVEDAGDGMITFNGKKYGPFQQIFSLNVAPDKSKFFAVAAKDGKLRFLSSDGRDVPASGMAERILMSHDGTFAVAVCRGTFTPLPGIEIDMSKIDPDSFEDVFLYAIDGFKFGPIHRSQDFGDIWFARGSQNWLFTVGESAYLNGKLLRKFPSQVQKETFWIDNAKRYAWTDSDQVCFSDGACFPFPVMIRHENAAGRTTLCWISLQKNGDVMAYRRTL
jgi:hypothetical protein